MHIALGRLGTRLLCAKKQAERAPRVQGLYEFLWETLQELIREADAVTPPERQTRMFESEERMRAFIRSEQAMLPFLAVLHIKYPRYLKQQVAAMAKTAARQNKGSTTPSANTARTLKGNLPALKGATEADLARVCKIANISLPAPTPMDLDTPGTSAQHAHAIQAQATQRRRQVRSRTQRTSPVDHQDTPVERTAGPRTLHGKAKRTPG
jgi:hypothetical protein